MCGIFAVLNSNSGAPRKIENFVKDCLIAGAVRGSDSTGMFNITGNRKVLYQKLPVNGTYFVNDKCAMGMIEQSHNKCITIGHNRKATQGGITLNNAHPFITDQDANGDYTIGIHNGSLTDWKSKKYGSKYDVDSEWAINHINLNGLAAFKDITGPYVFIWYDTKDSNVIHIARNGERTLYYQYFGPAKDAEGKQIRTGTVIMASEHGMLAWLAARNELPVGEGKIYIVEPGFDYAFNIDDVTKFTKTELPKAVETARPHARTTINTTQDDTRKRITRELNKIFGGVVTNGNAAENSSSNIDPADGLVSSAEYQTAIFHKELGEAYQFLPAHWDDVNNEMVGEIVYNFGGGPDALLENLPAVMRGVDKIDAAKAIRGDFRMIKGKVIGIQEQGVNDKGDYTYILGSPHYALKPQHNLPALSASGAVH